METYLEDSPDELFPPRQPKGGFIQTSVCWHADTP